MRSSSSGNLFSRLRSRWRAARSVDFLIADDGQRLTYTELETRSAQLAGLLASAGVAPGDRVAAQVDKSVPALILYLAVVRAGGVFVPLNPAYTPSELAYFLGDAAPTVFVHRSGDAAAEAEAHSARIAAIFSLGADGRGSLSDAADAQAQAFEDVDRDETDPAAILYTSGTTGRSKGAVLSHGALWSNAATLAEVWRFTPQDRLLHALPIFHTHGLFVATNVTLAAGASMIFLPGFDAATVMGRLPEATVLMGVPTFYTRLLADPAFGRSQTQGMRLFISGSAPLPAVAHEAFRARTGHAILERYGMTETNMNTSNPYDGERRPGSVGPALPATEVRICDPDTGRTLPVGEVGEIEIRGPNLFSGYWNLPEKTAEEFRADGFFRSGDLGRIDAQGYVHIVGRAKDLIIAGGFNIYPAEIEGVIEKIEGVAECAVVAAPHPDLGEAAVALVVARSGSGLSVEGVQAAIETQLARYKQPRRVLLTGSLPRNAMGKVQKTVLRDQVATLFSG